jgi:Asp-tRNA(Asn)/Glu-tRNA(Gln) amidotransferase A subunit family amidase
MTDAELGTVRAAADAVRSGDVSAEELAQRTLDTLERTEPHVHAYVRVDAEGALERARHIDRGMRAGADVGPLNGAPIAIKDVLLTAGLPTEAGSRVLEGFVPDHDATAVRFLREAGANIIGKLVTHEFACGQDRPPTRNAWHLDHYPGGSSAGAGPAVALGSALAALGTDSGGSVRKPAALNGVTGLKPTYGRISHEGVIPGGSSLDHVGIIARTADDCALLLEVIGRSDPSDPGSLAAPAFRARADADVPTRRLGVDRASLDWILEDEIRDAFDAALETLVDLGATLVDVELARPELVDAAGFTIFLAEAAAYHRRWLDKRGDDYAPQTRQMLEVGALIPAMDLDLAQRARRLLARDTAAVFRDNALDAVVSPTVPMLSMPMADMVPSDVGRYLPYLFPANLTGQPAISVPCGTSSSGSPIGLHIVGAPMADDVVLAIATAYQGATAWHEARPPLALGSGAGAS